MRPGRAALQALQAQRPALVRYLRARGAGDDAEDMVQDIWLRLDSVDLDAVDNLTGYLYRIAHNLVLDRIRNGRRRAEREVQFHANVFGEDGRVDLTAEHRLIAQQRLMEIDRVLVALGPRTDMIFRRHRIEQVPQIEIARELGITVSAIEKHLQKAYRAVADVQRRFRAEASDPLPAPGHDHD